jgi:hypothetical protein
VNPGGMPSAVENQDLTDDAAQNAFEVGNSSRVSLVVQDANPLLYKYELKDEKKTKLKSTEDLEAFGKSIGDLQGSLGKLGGGEGAALAACDSADDFLKTAKEVRTAIDQSDTVRVESETNREHMMQLVNVWKIATWRKDFDNLADKVRAEAPMSSATCRASYALALGLLPDIDKTINRLAQIKSLAEQVGKPLLLTTYSIGRTELQEFTIHIEKNGKWPADMVDPKRFIGDRKSSIAPYEAVPVRLVPSMTCSFVDERSYEAKASGDKFTITETKKDVTGLDLAAALEFSPKALDFSTWNGVVQFGISPQKNLGFFLGAGMNVPSVFTVGFGITYQQVERLAAGLSPNQTIEKADALKTKKKFDSGLYVFITLPKKK